MSLSRFSIIVAIDAGNGIAKDGAIPWSNRADMKFFRDMTIGKGRNVVVMGRVTYESIPEPNRPLEGRKCVVVSRTWKQDEHPEVIVYPSLLEALVGLGGNMLLYDDVFICGGEQIYAEAIRDYIYLCRNIHVTRFKTDYDCDQYFPFDDIKDMPKACDPSQMRDYSRFVFTPKMTHPELQYLALMERVVESGEVRPDRTGVGTRSIFGTQMEYDISERVPIFTTKKVVYDAVIRELLFFISGKTNTRTLEEQGVRIWHGNTTREFLDKQGLTQLQEGDMGALYGFQWRHWGAPYTGCDTDYADQGIDQLKNLIQGIRDTPHSRRHVLSAWNVSQLKDMPLAPCHVIAQFNVSTDRRHLDCCMFQRSADLFLGVPFNVASYAILTYMIAHITGLRPRRFVHFMGDTHIYSNHGDAVNRQLKKTPRPFPTLKFRRATKIKEIDDFTFDDFIVEGYSSWPFIKVDMAI